MLIDFQNKFTNFEMDELLFYAVYLSISKLMKSWQVIKLSFLL